jgi:hypothetical protein
MKQSPRVFHWVAVLGVALAACGTSVRPSASEPAAPPATAVAETTLRVTVPPDPTALPTLIVPTPAATSRGPELEASDPELARLDTGSLQLVEFFRFT